MTTEYDTVANLSFAFKHNTKDPKALGNVEKIRLAIINKVAFMDADEILTQIEFSETIEGED
tara:strand:- start:1152 stop:1337 length:186 start_codon:yes stop_codon:yes gene_type:complete